MRVTASVRNSTSSPLQNNYLTLFHIAARWKHDTKTGPQAVHRKADDLQYVAADNGLQDPLTKYETVADDIEYLVRYRGSSVNAAVTNVLNRGNGYTQWWMAKTSYSTTVRSLGWYR